MQTTEHNLKRTFPKNPPIICYNSPAAALVPKIEYEQKRLNALNGDVIEELIVPKKSARTWTMQKGDLCSVTVIEGPQVCDINFWNLENKKERFYSGKTRQLHSTHLKVYDRLWSCLPYLRPMATFVYDSLGDYGIDMDGGSLHDVIGTRCDDYTYKLITGKDRFGSCHSYLTEAVRKCGLDEEDVHDVWNVFMLTGFTKDTQQYFCKPSPCQKGDCIQFIADMDLLVALSCCPQGDVSIPVGESVPDSKCHPLQVKIFRVLIVTAQIIYRGPMPIEKSVVSLLVYVFLLYLKILIDPGKSLFCFNSPHVFYTIITYYSRFNVYKKIIIILNKIKTL